MFTLKDHNDCIGTFFCFFFFLKKINYSFRVKTIFKRYIFPFFFFTDILFNAYKTTINRHFYFENQSCR